MAKERAPCRLISLAVFFPAYAYGHQILEQEGFPWGLHYGPGLEEFSAGGRSPLWELHLWELIYGDAHH